MVNLKIIVFITNLFYFFSFLFVSGNRSDANNGPFYLSVINKPKSYCWYKSLKMGINTINSFMKSMKIKIFCLKSAKTKKNHKSLKLEKVVKTCNNKFNVKVYNPNLCFSFGIYWDQHNNLLFQYNHSSPLKFFTSTITMLQ